jgi:gamma-glutamyltranspeptidase
VKAGVTEHHNTTHFSIVDQWGNAVSNTYTLNDWFGCGEVVTGTGFLLNNEIDKFSARPGVPNLDGVVGGDANAIEPGKRPLSTMTPTILTWNGRVAIVIGTPGGSRIATSIFQVLTNWHDYHMPLAAAVAAPRVHHQLLPEDTIFEEPFRGLDATTRAALITRGYKFETQSWNGDIQAIVLEASVPEAAADPRGRGVGRVLDLARTRSERLIRHNQAVMNPELSCKRERDRLPVRRKPNWQRLFKGSALGFLRGPTVTRDDFSDWRVRLLEGAVSGDISAKSFTCSK